MKKNYTYVIKPACINCLIYYMTRSFLLWTKAIQAERLKRACHIAEKTIDAVLPNDASIIFFLSDIAAVMAPSRDIQSAAALSGDTRHDCRSGSCRSFSSSDLTLREFKSLYYYYLCSFIFIVEEVSSRLLLTLPVVSAQCSEKRKKCNKLVHSQIINEIIWECTN